ncbi:MAG: hypothetical protein KAU28_03955, partial [Phycisphaerae bacterium]|nr:hypothetical protein [Phycisphaerae bacterium]
KKDLGQWDKAFAESETLLYDPAAEAGEVLEQIDRHIRELGAAKAMLGEYAELLRKALEDYRATTQPAVRRGSRSETYPSCGPAGEAAEGK